MFDYLASLSFEKFLETCKFNSVINQETKFKFCQVDEAYYLLLCTKKCRLPFWKNGSHL